MSNKTADVEAAEHCPREQFVGHGLHTVFAHRVQVVEFRPDGHYREVGTCTACDAEVHRVWGPSQEKLRERDPWNRWRLVDASIDDQWPVGCA